MFEKVNKLNQRKTNQGWLIVYLSVFILFIKFISSLLSISSNVWLPSSNYHKYNNIYVLIWIYLEICVFCIRNNLLKFISYFNFLFKWLYFNSNILYIMVIILPVNCSSSFCKLSIICSISFFLCSSFLISIKILSLLSFKPSSDLTSSALKFCKVAP